jgi:glutathione S-transferase
MFTLHHLWLSPACRAVRVVLAEKDLECDLVIEHVWERQPDFLRLNPACEVPVLVTDAGDALCGTTICEYVDEVYRTPPLIGENPLARAETRRLVAWFDDKFGREVTDYLVGEKVTKRLAGSGHPDSESIRAGKHNVHYHLDYVGYLFERRKWLAGDTFGLADITAAAHLSCVDYLGDVPWDDHPAARDWYARIKSRPSFRSILADHVPGLPPPRHYADLDF